MVLCNGTLLILVLKLRLNVVGLNMWFNVLAKIKFDSPNVVVVI